MYRPQFAQLFAVDGIVQWREPYNNAVLLERMHVLASGACTCTVYLGGGDSRGVAFSSTVSGDLDEWDSPSPLFIPESGLLTFEWLPTPASASVRVQYRIVE